MVARAPEGAVENGNGVTRWLHATFELGGGPARLISMEGLRGLAVFLVFLHHYAVQVQHLWPQAGGTPAAIALLRHYGNLGVELFFVLSGFLIYGTLVAKTPPFFKFMRRRCQRIYPAFLPVFGLLMLLHLAMPGKLPSEPVDATIYLIANLLLLPGLFPIEPLMAVAWSLSYEMFFYLATAAAVALLKLGERPAAARIALILALAALLMAIPGSPIRMLPFFAGMLLWEAARANWRAVPAWLGLAAPVAGVVVTQALTMRDGAQQAIYTLGFLLLCSACFAGAGAAHRIFAWAPLRWLGNMSYSYYLVHGLCVGAAFLVMRKLGASDLTWWMLPPVFAFSLVPSTMLFIYIEKPLSLSTHLDAPPKRSAAAPSASG